VGVAASQEESDILSTENTSWWFSNLLNLVQHLVRLCRTWLSACDLCSSMLSSALELIVPQILC